MTPFAQLQAGASLEKSATPFKFLKAVPGLVRHGFWKTVANKTNAGDAGIRGVANRASRWFHDPTVGKMGQDGMRAGKSTLLSKGLTAYGLGGLGLGMAGYNVPGSSLALNATMPGMGMLFTAPGAITAARMARKKNQDMLKGDVLDGGRQAAADMMSLAQTDSRYATNPGMYGKFLSEYSPEMSALANKYTTGNVNRMGKWNTIGSMLENPQSVINNRMDQFISDKLNKSGSMEKSGMTALRAAGRGAKKVFPWLFPALGVGAIGHAAFSKKPYDAAQAQQRGYAGAGAAAQKIMGSMSPMERMALRLDPTLLGQKIEAKLPGTINTWEKNTGQTFRPGLIARTVDSWSKGSDPSYYEYDAAGKRHYI